MNEHQPDDQAQRLQRFRQTARAIGEEIERRGLTEDEVMAQLEEAKAEVYQEYYGESPKAGQGNSGIIKKKRR